MAIRKLAVLAALIAAPALAQTAPAHAPIPVVIPNAVPAADPPPGYLPTLVVQRDGAGRFTCGLLAYSGDVIPATCPMDNVPHAFTAADGSTGHVVWSAGSAPVVTP